MSAARAVLSAIFSRYTLALLGITALGLLLWFGGPHVGFGNSRPLEAASTRVTVLLLTLSFLLFWLLHWPVSIVGVAALCLLIWYGFPLLHVGDIYPFASETVRLLCISVLVLFFVIYLLYRLWLALRANEALLQKILHPGKDKDTSPAQEQLLEVQTVIQRAMRQLRSLTGSGSGSGLRNVFLHSRFIYQLPWYMIFGAPGTGKTTAILNSGLKFPLSDQAGNVSLAGISGTRNCLWWFTNEAVLIDTAGRYTTHESDATVDSAEWTGFLGLLRKYRPRAPINGALLTVNVEDLITRSHDERRLLAAQLRERLQELQKELRILFPVYVLVTKMDLLKGFQPYFHNLNTEGRSQVMGFTLPLPGRAGKAGQNSPGSHEGSHEGSRLDVRALCEGEMRLLRQRLEQGMDTRLREEYDQDKRRQLYCLPGEFEGLCQPLLQLIDDIFFEAGSSLGLMRGVYFTSAVQQENALSAEPNTFLQRVSHWARLAHSALRQGENRPMVDSRSYFLQHLLRKVVFPESFLVQRNRRWEMRFMLVRSLGHALLIMAALGLGGALLTSEHNNTALLESLEQRTASLGDAMQKLRESGDSGGSSASGDSQRHILLPKVLQDACSLTDYSELNLASPPMAYGMGLFAAAPAAAEAENLCQRLRRQLLLPELAKRLEDQLRARLSSIEEAKADTKQERSRQLYEALHVYAAFHDPARYDQDLILNWLHQDMASDGNHFLHADSSLPDHVRAVLTGGTFARPTQADGTLVTSSRAALQGIGKPERLYILARHQMSTNASGNVEDFIPALTVSDTSSLFRADGLSLAAPVPALFTYAGYHNIVQPTLAHLLSQAAALDAWLMGEAPTARSSDAEQKRLQRAVRKLYFEEYSRHWQALVDNVRVSMGATPERAMLLLSELGSAASPLDKLARAVVLETTLAAREPLIALPGAGGEGAPGGKEGGAGGKLDKINKGFGAAASLNPADLDMITLVDKPFEALRATVTGSVKADNTRALPDSPALKEIHALFTEYALHMQETFKSESTQSLPAPSDIADRLRAKARQLPPFYSAALEDLAEQGHQKAGAVKVRTLAKLMDTQINEPCRKLVQTSYPFVRQGRDADAAAFTQLFGPGGVLDSYFVKHLADMVDISTSPWKYTKITEGAPPLAPFEQAARIREALFRSPDAKGWSLEYVFHMADMDPRIERVSLNIGEKQWQYEHGPSQPMDVVWQGASPKAMVEMAFRPRLGLKPLRFTGPWALLRFLEKGVLTQGSTPGQYWLEFDLSGHRLALEVQTPEQMPINTQLFESFQCPQSSQ